MFRQFLIGLLLTSGLILGQIGYSGGGGWSGTADVTVEDGININFGTDDDYALGYNAANDKVQLVSDNNDWIVRFASVAAATSDDIFDFEVIGLAAMDGSDTVNVLTVDVTNGNHTGSTNFLRGAYINLDVADAQTDEYGLVIGDAWDKDIVFVDDQSVILFGTNSINLDSVNGGGISISSATSSSGESMSVRTSLSTSRPRGVVGARFAAGAANGSDDFRVFTVWEGLADAAHTGSNNTYTIFDAPDIGTLDADIVHIGLRVDADFDAGIMLEAKSSSWAATDEPQTNFVAFYVDESVDRSVGTATADCALIGRIPAGTEIVITVLVTDGGC